MTPQKLLTADISNYNQRIATGKIKEKKIVDQLRKYGIRIEDPTPHEDMYDKIDGWMHDSKGVKNSIQIKFRESGDDIIFEMVKDFDRNAPGRDMISKAQLYLVVDRSGSGKLIRTEEVKKKAQELLKVVESDLKQTPNKTRWSNVGWEVKITQDRAHGQNKLMGYFNPKMFSIIHNWKFAL